MSNLFETLIDPVSRKINNNCNTKSKPKKNKCALKSKENIFKPQCRRELKKKLKKYKLRRDGQEDPEVLDVSQILVSSLKIKSPTSSINNNVLSDPQEELKPKNYLFKMGRRKQILKKKELGNCITDASNHKSDLDLHPSDSIENSKIEDKQKNSQTEVNEAKFKNKDKKETNAFQLMMDSRNKSIGSNSPGKDKVIDETELQDYIEKKNIKAKRNLLLQKMAEAKGSLKKKEMEEYQEQCLQKKMEKRAERLKKMVTNQLNKKSKYVDDVQPLQIKKNDKPPENDSDVEIVSTKKEISGNNNDSIAKPKTLKIVNIFQGTLQNVSPNSKNLKKSKEDDEFLKKLSPSLKKKENMLCYFKKVEKESELDEIFSAQDIEDDKVIIKVKMTQKSKKSLKKKKLSLNKDLCNAESQKSNYENKEVMLVQSNMKQDEHKNSHIIADLKSTDNNHDLVRPRRNIKRPAKYVDDVQPSSSDEELHIFTPKKKKQNKKDIDVTDVMVQTSEESKTSNHEKKGSITINNAKLSKKKNKKQKPTKLAPIFAAKPQIDAAAIEAKQRFLSSGVPEKLKKIVEKPTPKNIGDISFQTVVHVQQKDLANAYIDCEFNFNQSEIDEDPDNVVSERDFFKNMIKSLQITPINSNLFVSKGKANDILQKIKQSYPRFPVYRTYRMLKDKNRGEFKDCSYLNLDNSIEVMNGLIDCNTDAPDKLSWTDKYKATSSKQIIGNFENIKELKKWLVSWTENDAKLKKAYDANSDSSDFYQSDTDSKDSMKSANNLLVINGPVGSGKTSIVYAVAAELSIKVLEVNASSKRTGKIMLQDLQEATQSHKVNRGSSKSSQDNSQKSQEIIAFNEVQNKVKKRGRPKKAGVVETALKKAEAVTNVEVASQPNSQESTRTCMSLILIDDADIVFEQDDGFCSAIVQLVQCSKRPVILITSSMTCPHLQRFLQFAKILHTRPFFPKMLGTWLDILCLADSGMCWPGLGAKILDYFNGDIRKSTNFLQFYAVKELINDSQTASQNGDLNKIDIEDENSSMSWTDREGNDDRIEKSNTINKVDDSFWHLLMKEQANLSHIKYPPQLFNIWWNVPRLVNAPSYQLQCETENEQSCKDKRTDKLGLDAISRVADMISIADCYRRKDKEFEITAVPWASFESHSVSEQENLDKYDRNGEIMDEISHSLVTGSILAAQSALDLEHNTRLEFPGMAIKRDRDKIASRHNNVSSFLNPSSALDRRALALDYWSSCRAICRIEKSRTDHNSKRNNRFCHYLKSANILCKGEAFDNLGNSLCTEDRI